MKTLKERWSDDVFSGFVGHGAKSVLIFLCFKGGVDESGTEMHEDFTPAIKALFAMSLDHVNEAIMRELESLCAPWVVLEEQRHGDVIEMMSGWAHAVHMLYACWKMAFDYLKITTMPEIAVMHRMRGAQLIGQRSAEDYAAAMHICVDELINILSQHAM